MEPCLQHAARHTARPQRPHRDTSRRRGVSSEGVQGLLRPRGRHAPPAAVESGERVEAAALVAPALRHAGAQHRGAPHMRSAHALPLLVARFELRGAARHAALPGAPPQCIEVPILKHGQVCAAAGRHATCRPACKSDDVLNQSSSVSVVFRVHQVSQQSCAVLGPLNLREILLWLLRCARACAAQVRACEIGAPGGHARGAARAFRALADV